MNKFKEYFGTSGLMHIIVSAILLSALNWVFPIYESIFIAFTLGLAKELIWDKLLERGVCSKKDLFADAIGILIGCM